MKTDDVIAGLQTLAKYYDKAGGYNCGAEHDVIYAYTTDQPLSDFDLYNMIKLGWTQEHDERDYGEEFKACDYRQDSSWHAYV